MQTIQDTADVKVRPYEVDGFEFQIVREDPHGFYRVDYKGRDYEVSKPLQGRFTSIDLAHIEIGVWVKEMKKLVEQAKEDVSRQKIEEKIKKKEVELEAAQEDVQEMDAALKPKDKRNGKRTSL